MVAEVRMVHFGKFGLADVDLVQEEDERFGHLVLWYYRSYQPLTRSTKTKKVSKAQEGISRDS
jgi:hypothetical protein